MLTVTQLWRHPVKSMLGEQVESSEVTEIGLVGDRAFGVVDVETGKVLTGRRAPKLLFTTARWHDGEVEVVGPDGEHLDSDDALSFWLERPVRLVRAGDEGGVYENPRDAENEADWVEWQGPGRAWHDSSRARVSLVSTGTIGAWAPTRFRANVLLEGAGEADLVGRSVTLGSAVLSVQAPLSRCVMVTRAQPGIEVDRDVLRTIHREHGGTLAIGALVSTRGRVRVGDAVLPS